MPDLTSKPHTHTPRSAPRILLIQDDPGLARLLSDYLGSHGLRVTVTESAQSLAQAKTAEWDLIILDIMPTGAKGSEVLRELRAVSIVPLLVLVGEDIDNELLPGLQRGVDSYLPRTASTGEFLAHIHALSAPSMVMRRPERSPPASDQTTLSVGGLRLQPTDHAVQVNGAPVTLTSLEFELLASLMRHTGAICSRAQLLSELRSRGFAISEHLIDAHFSGLRRKFRERSHSARFIFKIRGVGYVLMDPDTLKA